MKTIFYLLMPWMLFVSCESDSLTNDPRDGQSMQSYAKVSDNYPANPDNAFDFTGQIYFDISDSYAVREVYHEHAERRLFIADSIAAANSNFITISGPGYSYADITKVLYFLGGDSQMLGNVLVQSGLNAYSIASLGNFVNTVWGLQEQKRSYDTFYNYIIAYERNILTDPNVPKNDLKIILTTSSLLRYGFYFTHKQKQKPRDRTWDITWGCIIAGIQGGGQNIAKAVELFTVTGVLANK